MPKRSSTGEGWETRRARSDGREEAGEARGEARKTAWQAGASSGNRGRKKGRVGEERRRRGGNAGNEKNRWDRARAGLEENLGGGKRCDDSPEDVLAIRL